MDQYSLTNVFNFLQIVYVIIAIASWYYPDPDVATSNGIEGILGGFSAGEKNVTVDAELLRQLLNQVVDVQK